MLGLPHLDVNVNITFRKKETDIFLERKKRDYKISISIKDIYLNVIV